MKGSTRISGITTSTNTGALTITDSSALFNASVKIGDIFTSTTVNQSAKVTSVISDTTLQLDSDVINGVDDYTISSDYIRVDLFEDESVSITDSILNIRDIKKIFSPFSQQFNLPASKNNNKIFRHYENSDIENSFDARYRTDAIIKLNGVDYKKGKILFKSVSLKDNSPHAYKVVFYGETVELKEILGEDELSSLETLSQFDFDYDLNTVVGKFDNDTGGGGGSDVIFPNIHHSANMRFTNNGYRDNITGNKLKFTDLKPAIKVQRIIEAISEEYPRLKFENGFFNSQNFSSLYLWLHREKGFMSNAEEGGGIKRIYSRFYRSPGMLNKNRDWDLTSGNELRKLKSFGWNVYAGQIQHNRYRLFLDVNVTNTSVPYNIILINNKDGSEFIRFDGLTGDQNNLEYLIDFEENGLDEADIMFVYESENTLNIQQSLFVYRIQSQNHVWVAVDAAAYRTDAEDTDTKIVVPSQMPKMKIIDFLSNLFKLFNLVVYKEGNNIVVSTPIYWQQSGNNLFDITKYVDMSSATVERLFQYKNMVFDFKSKKSFLVQYSDDIQGNKFSQESYGNAEWDGGDYRVEVDFEKMMYERLNNVDTEVLSSFGQGAMLDKDFKPTIGKPLLFYVQETDADDSFEVTDARGENEISIDQYNRPTQLAPFTFQDFSNRTSLNFGVEADEYLQAVQGTGKNLFSEGYLNYVQTAFDKQSRLLKVTAYLPLGIVNTYKMNDTFVINNKPYILNKIKTNLLTNKSELELYTERPVPAQDSARNVNPTVAQVEDLRVSNITNGSITIDFTGVDGGVEQTGEYYVRVDDSDYMTIGNVVTGQAVSQVLGNLVGKTFNANTFYQIQVSKVYDDGGTVFQSTSSMVAAQTLI